MGLNIRIPSVFVRAPILLTYKRMVFEALVVWRDPLTIGVAVYEQELTVEDAKTVFLI